MTLHRKLHTRNFELPTGQFVWFDMNRMNDAEYGYFFSGSLLPGVYTIVETRLHEERAVELDSLHITRVGSDVHFDASEAPQLFRVPPDEFVMGDLSNVVRLQGNTDVKDSILMRMRANLDSPIFEVSVKRGHHIIARTLDTHFSCKLSIGVTSKRQPAGLLFQFAYRDKD